MTSQAEWVVRAPGPASECPHGAARTTRLHGGTALETFTRAFGAHDLVLVAYLVLMSALVWRAGPGVAQAACARRLYGAVAVLVLGCLVGRLDSGIAPRVRSIAYRATLVAVVVEAYLMLRVLLPTVRTDSVDEALVGIDVALLGFEPALWLEPFTTPVVVEYFAFFYFSYFWLCLAFCLGVVGLGTNCARTSEFAIGTALVYCVGQLGYVAVPGFGPIRHLAGAFADPLQGGFFWRCVLRTVEAGSAMKDIFPSLHTAAPVWFTLYAWHRARVEKRRVWAWIAAITAVFAVQIVAATIVLRWHYFVDVLAGLALALIVAQLAPWVASAEQRLRVRLGWPSAWSFGASTRAEPSEW